MLSWVLSGSEMVVVGVDLLLDPDAPEESEALVPSLPELPEVGVIIMVIVPSVPCVIVSVVPSGRVREIVSAVASDEEESVRISGRRWLPGCEDASPPPDKVGRLMLEGLGKGKF